MSLSVSWFLTLVMELTAVMMEDLAYSEFFLFVFPPFYWVFRFPNWCHYRKDGRRIIRSTGKLLVLDRFRPPRPAAAHPIPNDWATSFGRPGRQEALRGPTHRLQPAHPARRQQFRSANCQTRPQTIAAHRCGTYKHVALSSSRRFFNVKTLLLFDLEFKEPNHDH